MGISIINGKTYVGNNISINNGVVTIDGVRVESDKNEKKIDIVVTGDINTLSIDSCDSIKVDGNVQKLSTTSGDVEISGHVEGSVTSVSGDIECGYVTGDIQTTSGNVTCKEVKGNVSTISGNVKHCR